MEVIAVFIFPLWKRESKGVPPNATRRFLVRGRPELELGAKSRLWATWKKMA
jgi:hypothetical protein